MTGRNNGSAPRWWSILRRRNREEDLAAYRRLALQLRYELTAGGDATSVLFVSPRRSFVSARGSMLLACCAAEELHRPILLVDLCERHPEPSRMLEVEGRAGFAELRSGVTESWRRLVLPTAQDNVYFLPAGTSSNNSQAAPTSIEAFLRDAEKEYGLVVLSGGSVLEDSAASAVAPLAGCVLLAVIENETRLDELDAAQKTLAMCGARKIGLLMTIRVRGKAPAFQAKKHGDTQPH